MTPEYFLLLLGLAALPALLYPRWRRRRILARPFPAAWFAALHKALPFFHRLKPGEQQRLLDLIRLFIAGKQFHGCGGLAIDDEIRVVIAAHACLLLLNRKTAIYPRLQHILVYPADFIKEEEELHEDGVVSEVSVDLHGESWHYGKVILSWDKIEHDITHFRDGENVILHEFAHQLDSEAGGEDGAPELRQSRRDEWADVMSAEFAALNAAAERDEDTLIDPYGASDPAEFFAVVTEIFFSRPDEMAAEHPRLFAVLHEYYRVDPREWY
jgi:hypothetical protein